MTQARYARHMDIALKIRGIFSTALTRFFLDRGVEIVAPSEEILKRFGASLRSNSYGSGDGEISDLESGQGILLTGFPDAVEHVGRILRDAFFDAIVRRRLDDPLERVVEIEFPYIAKSGLDALRNTVVPTLPGHHRVKLIDPEYLERLEKTELRTDPSKRSELGRSAEEELFWKNYRPGKEIEIEHVKPDGRLIHLSEGEILEADPAGRRLLLKRSRFKGRNRYDGLDIPKEEGDYALTEVVEAGWYYHHTYYRRNHRVLGSYYNINTPVEFYPEKIRYVDLEIDVVKRGRDGAEIIDRGELREQFEAGRISERLKKIAEDTAKDLLDLV